jgi:prolyl oligopeptidase
MHPFNSLSAFVVLLGLAAVMLAQSPVGSINTASGNRLSYPVARKGEQVDDYHGTKVADPYRWLEDLDSAETRAWVEAENKLTFDYLKQIPERAAIKERLTKLWNYERYGIPYKEGGRYFYAKMAHQ